LAENVYEGMLILDPNRYGREPAAVSGQISEMIEKLGGELLVSRLWEERRLAYSIKGHRKGTYWLTYFRLKGDQLVELRRQCRLNDSILRVLFVRVDPRIVDALVTHAQAATTSGAAAAGEKPKEEPGDEAQFDEEAKGDKVEPDDVPAVENLDD